MRSRALARAPGREPPDALERALRRARAVALGEPVGTSHLPLAASPRATNEEVGSAVRMATSVIAKRIMAPWTTRAGPAVGTSWA